MSTFSYFDSPCDYSRLTQIQDLFGQVISLNIDTSVD